VAAGDCPDGPRSRRGTRTPMRRATQLATLTHIAVRRLTRSATGLPTLGVTPTSSGAPLGRRMPGSPHLRRDTVNSELSGCVRGFSSVTLIGLAHSPEARRGEAAVCGAPVRGAGPEVAPARHQRGREQPRIPPVAHVTCFRPHSSCRYPHGGIPHTKRYSSVALVGGCLLNFPR